ncbi:MAG: hypothetical protein AAF357_07575 [Verrucomicrobiota bacterium]
MPFLIWPAITLFTSIWSIYLFDRLYDTRDFKPTEETPWRHSFTARHRRGFFLLLTLSSIATAVTLLLIPPHIWIGGALLGTVTVIYYLLFRFFHSDSNPRHRWPWKEFFIATCFSGGVLLCSPGLGSELMTALLGLSLASLFFCNCLMISKAEASFDQQHDSAGFYSSGGSSRSKTLVILPFSVLLLAIYLLAFTSLVLLGAALLVTSFVYLLMILSQKISDRWVQPLSDLTLVAAPLGVLAIHWVLSR